MGERTIAGALVGGNKPRIVEVQHIAVGRTFPHLYICVITTNPDLLVILEVFVKHGINIATSPWPTWGRW